MQLEQIKDFGYGLLIVGLIISMVVVAYINCKDKDNTDYFI